MESSIFTPTARLVIPVIERQRDGNFIIRPGHEVSDYKIRMFPKGFY